MKVSFVDCIGSKYTLKGKRKALLNYLNGIVHTLSTAKKSGLVRALDNLGFNFPDGVICKETTAYICCCISDLPALKAARRTVAAKVLGVPSV